ncbi:hypothetical protein PR048_026890 [Dryococelus australis]|uniref:Uncharacterized protein n=1 Tax=Dryococelus australis TaxID=614101 RepID=A0ABQ9GMJ3_9NEOP|nr:hypothetical protein PR048_026890 [Dryococelus australis]
MRLRTSPISLRSGLINKFGACIVAIAGLSGDMAAIVAMDTPRKKKDQTGLPRRASSDTARCSRVTGDGLDTLSSTRSGGAGARKATYECVCVCIQQPVGSKGQPSLPESSSYLEPRKQASSLDLEQTATRLLPVRISSSGAIPFLLMFGSTLLDVSRAVISLPNTASIRNITTSTYRHASQIPSMEGAPMTSQIPVTCPKCRHRDSRIKRAITYVDKPNIGNITRHKYLHFEFLEVAKRLARSPPKAIRVQSPAGSLRIFARGNRAGRCSRKVFSGISRFPRPFIPSTITCSDGRWGGKARLGDDTVCDRGQVDALANSRPKGGGRKGTTWVGRKGTTWVGEERHDLGGGGKARLGDDTVCDRGQVDALANSRPKGGGRKGTTWVGEERHDLGGGGKTRLGDDTVCDRGQVDALANSRPKSVGGKARLGWGRKGTTWVGEERHDLATTLCATGVKLTPSLTAGPRVGEERHDLGGGGKARLGDDTVCDRGQVDALANSRHEGDCSPQLCITNCNIGDVNICLFKTLIGKHVATATQTRGPGQHTGHTITHRPAARVNTLATPSHTDKPQTMINTSLTHIHVSRLAGKWCTLCLAQIPSSFLASLSPPPFPFVRHYFLMSLFKSLHGLALPTLYASDICYVTPLPYACRMRRGAPLTEESTTNVGIVDTKQKTFVAKCKKANVVLVNTDRKSCNTISFCKVVHSVRRVTGHDDLVFHWLLAVVSCASGLCDFGISQALFALSGGISWKSRSACSVSPIVRTSDSRPCGHRTIDDVDRYHWLRTTNLRVPTLNCPPAYTSSKNGVVWILELRLDTPATLEDKLRLDTPATLEDKLRLDTPATLEDKLRLDTPATLEDKLRLDTPDTLEDKLRPGPTPHSTFKTLTCSLLQLAPPGTECPTCFLGMCYVTHKARTRATFSRALKTHYTLPSMCAHERQPATVITHYLACAHTNANLPQLIVDVDQSVACITPSSLASKLALLAITLNISVLSGNFTAPVTRQPLELGVSCDLEAICELDLRGCGLDVRRKYIRDDGNRHKFRASQLANLSLRHNTLAVSLCARVASRTAKTRPLMSATLSRGPARLLFVVARSPDRQPHGRSSAHKELLTSRHVQGHKVTTRRLRSDYPGQPNLSGRRGTASVQIALSQHASVLPSDTFMQCVTQPRHFTGYMSLIAPVKVGHNGGETDITRYLAAVLGSCTRPGAHEPVYQPLYEPSWKNRVLAFGTLGTRAGMENRTCPITKPGRGNLAAECGKCHDGCHTSPYTGRYGGPCTIFWHRVNIALRWISPRHLGFSEFSPSIALQILYFILGFDKVYEIIVHMFYNVYCYTAVARTISGLARRRSAPEDKRGSVRRDLVTRGHEWAVALSTTIPASVDTGIVHVPQTGRGNTRPMSGEQVRRQETTLPCCNDLLVLKSFPRVVGAWINTNSRHAGDCVMRINALIASTCKALSWRAVLPIQFDLGSNVKELHERNFMILDIRFVDLGSKVSDRD